MINLKAYNGKDLQTFLALLDQCEKKGIIEISFVKEKIQNHIHEVFLKSRIEYEKNLKKYPPPSQKEVEKVKLQTCPSCNNGLLQPLLIDGEKILSCKKCRYSEITEDWYDNK